MGQPAAIDGPPTGPGAAPAVDRVPLQKPDWWSRVAEASIRTRCGHWQTGLDVVDTALQRVNRVSLIVILIQVFPDDIPSPWWQF
jgi:hypothetical protein